MAVSSYRQRASLLRVSLSIVLVAFVVVLAFAGVSHVRAQNGIIYVDAAALGANDGTSWGDAFNDLQDALDEAGDGDEIWVAEGTYYPTDGSNREFSFVLDFNLTIYGGFPSGGSEFEDRNWEENETILSGNIGDLNMNADNSYNVVTVNIDVEASIDGVTITEGNADGLVFRSGGGIFIDQGTLTLTNSTVSGNTASWDGGGIGNSGGALTLIDSTVSGNSAINIGGGIYNGDGTLGLTNSTVSGNSVGFAGGGIGIFGGTVALTNSTVSGNTAGPNPGFPPIPPIGGGIWSQFDSPLELTSSIVAGNSATGSGVADLAANVSFDGGYNLLGGIGGATGLVKKSNIIGEDPRLGPLQNNGGPTETHLPLADSPALDRIPFGANGCGVTDEIDFDQRGVPRPLGTGCDIGAVERLTLELSVSSPVFVGEIVDVSVTIRDSDSWTRFTDVRRAEISGYGPTRILTLNADGIGSLSFEANEVGIFVLRARVGHLSDTAVLTVHSLPEQRGPRLHNVPGHITLDPLTPAGAILDYDLPTAVDTDGSPLEVTCDPPPGTWVPIGHTTVNCSATNSDDVTMSASFGVTVRPFTGPDFDHQDDIDNQWFWAVWARTDLPVRDGHTARTWMWGPGPFTESMFEPYTTELQNPGGDPVFLAIPEAEREVIYFDKARMEINDPNADPDDLWYITNGLLVNELITGNRQFGDDLFIQYEPSHSNVAGDADDLNGPTYASLQNVLDAPSQEIGTLLIEQIDRFGNVTTSESWGEYNVTVGHVDTVTEHSIAGPFWEFMRSEGLVYEDGNLFEDALFENPFYATGRPVTEAYWSDVKVDGEQRDVLLQCFERRCLTYTPGNSEGFVVEAGNVGQHYYHWRYVQAVD